MFFESWESLGRLVLVGGLAYAGLIAMLRLSGNRTLSKMNAFDLVVTVSLGSTLATVLLSPDVVLSEGLLAFGLLIALQFAVTWLSVRIPKVRTLVTAEPALLLYRGQFLEAPLRTSRVTHDDVRAAIRQSGLSDPAEVGAVVLEADGSMSVISAEPGSQEMPVLHRLDVPNESAE